MSTAKLTEADELAVIDAYMALSKTAALLGQRGAEQIRTAGKRDHFAEALVAQCDPHTLGLFRSAASRIDMAQIAMTKRAARQLRRAA